MMTPGGGCRAGFGDCEDTKHTALPPARRAPMGAAPWRRGGEFESREQSHYLFTDTIWP